MTTPSHQDEIDLDDIEAHNDAVGAAQPAAPSPVRSIASIATNGGMTVVAVGQGSGGENGGNTQGAALPTLPVGGSSNSGPNPTLSVNRSAPAARGSSFSAWAETTPGLVSLSIVFGMTALFPILFAERARPIDIFAFACFIPSIAVFYFAHKTWSKVATWRAFFGEYVIGFVALTPIVFFCSIVMMMIAVAMLLVALSPVNLRNTDVLGVLVEVVLAMSFTVVEEIFKYVLATRRYTSESLKNPKQYVLMPFMASLGLATGEAFNIALFIRKIVDLSSGAVNDSGSGRTHNNSTAPNSHQPQDAGSSSGHGSAGDSAIGPVLFVFIIVACCLVFIPTHILSGYYIGLGVAKRRVLNQTLATAQILIAPVLFRFAFFYTLFFLSGHTSGVALVLLIPLVAAFLIVVRRFESSMPQDYLQQTGFVNALGYGVLGSLEGDYDENETDDSTGSTVPSAEVMRANDFTNGVPRVAPDTDVTNVSISKLSL